MKTYLSSLFCDLLQWPTVDGSRPSDLPLAAVGGTLTPLSRVPRLLDAAGRSGHADTGPRQDRARSGGASFRCQAVGARSAPRSERPAAAALAPWQRRRHGADLRRCRTLSLSARVLALSPRRAQLASGRCSCALASLGSVRRHTSSQYQKTPVIN